MSEYIEISKEDKLDIHLDKISSILLDGGQVFHGDLVYLGRRNKIGFDIQTISGGRQLGGYWTESADAGRVPLGEMVQLNVGCRARKGTPFETDGVVKWMSLLLQYMTQKAYTNNDPRFDEAARVWSNQNIDQVQTTNSKGENDDR